MRKFLVHNKGDHVGVAVEDIAAGEVVAGVYLDTDEPTPEVAARENVPLGHKIALVDLEEGAPVLKYGIRIGLTRRRIERGQHVHTHNLRSARW